MSRVGDFNSQIILFLGFLLVIFLLEGLGLPGGRNLSLFLIWVMPFFLILHDLILRRRIVFPRKISILLALFLLFSSISTFFSVNLNQSFNLLLFFTTTSLIFIWVNSRKDHLREIIPKFIILLGILYMGVSFVIYYFINFIPGNGYQFVYSKFGSHNHLGDFLVLVVIYALFYFLRTNKSNFFLLLLISFPTLLISYSRSAYFSLAISMVFLLVYFFRSKEAKNPVIPIVGFLVLILILFFFFFGTLLGSNNIVLFRPLNKVLTEELNLGQKLLLAKRPDYFNQARQSFLERPLFGVGPGNFVYASKKYSTVVGNTNSSHNLFLDILVENGLLAFIPFTAAILLILRSAVRKSNLLSFMFLAQLINFQTDYTHTIYSFFLLFFIIGGLTYQE